jgi:hypothetical protein
MEGTVDATNRLVQLRSNPRAVAGFFLFSHPLPTGSLANQPGATDPLGKGPIKKAPEAAPFSKELKDSAIT